MISITIAWLVFPFFTGFLVFLLPRVDRVSSLITAIASGIYASLVLGNFLSSSGFNFTFLDNFGVTLTIDSLSGYFILTNAIVTLAVVSYCWQTQKSAYFYAQLLILHGSINAAFVCTDFMSLYVALEVSGIATALLIAYPRSDRSLWVSLRYLFISNVAMLFYLIGVILVYKSSRSFSYSGLGFAPPEALALICMGLMTKGGVFISGLWLPLTHSESETPVSAIMSGIVVKAAIYPLLRCAVILPDIAPIITFGGLATAVLGITYALFEADTKRMLAFSTVSHLGWILISPTMGGLYALTHGLAKASLFIGAGALPSRKFHELQLQPMRFSLWLGIAIAGLSMSGLPLLGGFGAKVMVAKGLLPWQEIVMNLVALGTAACFARLIFLPLIFLPKPQLPKFPETNSVNLSLGFKLAIACLIGSLVIANVAALDAYSFSNIAKAIGIIGAGWLIYLFIPRLPQIRLPQLFEEFEHLIGVMALIATLLFWAPWAI